MAGQKQGMEYSSLVRSYNTLSYAHQLRALLSAFYKSDEFNNLSKYELAKVISDDIFRNYEGEPIFKYRLANEFYTKDYIAAFEVKAKGSRTDFLVINGDTKSFEVKSKIDTLNRLDKQITDYGDVFEYNTLVVDRHHLDNAVKIIPDHYGIWIFEGEVKISYKEPSHSPNINASAQLSLFNKKELVKSFGVDNKPTIVSSYTAETINQELKSTLKRRYADRWNFIQSNWNQILPIDVQFFFNTNVDPAVVYENQLLT